MNTKEVLITANTAVSEGDYEKFLSFCTDDTKWVFVGDRTLKGKEAVREYMATAYAEPPKFRVDMMIAEGDYLTALGEISLKDKSGRWINYEYCDVWRFNADKLAELKAFVSRIADQ